MNNHKADERKGDQGDWADLTANFILWLKVRNCVAHENHVRIPVYVTPFWGMKINSVRTLGNARVQNFYAYKEFCDYSDRICRNIHPQLYLPTCTCRNMHPQLYLPTCTHTSSRRHLYLHSRTQTSGCIKGRQAVLRSALSHEWTTLWWTGRLGITISEDIDTAVEKLRANIRARRNPLLDRKLFHCWDQEEGESIDQHVAALIRIDRTCAYDNEPHCTRCHRPCGHGAALTETRTRDRLIYGLADKGIQQRVLEEDFSERLDLERVVTICKSMESSNETEL